MEHNDTPLAPVSWGELLDKLTILEIKCEKIPPGPASINVKREYSLLSKIGEEVLNNLEISSLFQSLRLINTELWLIEDMIRASEASGDFGEGFIVLARSVYQKNDERAKIKREINYTLKSNLIEEKLYN